MSPAQASPARPGDELATTVRDAALAVLRGYDARVLFGNPGTTELAFLNDLPDDFDYVLGLNEVAITGIADGYAQATGRPVLLNLHTAAGLGNAMGALVNAHAARSPLVVLVGQQARELIGIAGVLTNTAPLLLPLGAVKHVEQPACAEDVPAALARAFHLATQAPQGPVCVSVPMDDWQRQPAPGASATAAATRVHGRPVLSAEALDGIAARLRSAHTPALVIGPGADTSTGFWAAAELADRLDAPVWATPWAYRTGFPTNHPAFQGQLPLTVEGVAKTLAGHDVVLSAGGPVFRYLSADDGAWPVLTPQTSVLALTDDPLEAARNAAGETWVGDVGPALRGLCDRLPHPETARPGARTAHSPDAGHGLAGYGDVFAVLNEVCPAETVVVNEPPQGIDDLMRVMPRTLPGGFYFAAACGLGFAAAGAIGIQLAEPARPVVAVLGDGSLQYSLQALWTAARHRLPVTFVVVNNSGYGILKDLAHAQDFGRLPGMELPGIDIPALAHGYGCPHSASPPGPNCCARCAHPPRPARA